MKNNHCIDCNKLLKNYHAKRCWNCHCEWMKIPENNGMFGKEGKKRESNGNYKNGKYCEDVVCIEKECNNKVSKKGNRCIPCSINHRFDGRSLKKHYCIEPDCSNEICYENFRCGNRRCKVCANKKTLNPNWKEIKKDEEYPSGFNNKLKEQIRKRDNYICQKCFITEEEHLIVYGKNLHVHHIDYNRKNCKDSNLITLCNECNLRVNANRNYWEDYFKNKIKRFNYVKS